MSSLWKYNSDLCDGDFCPGNCDYCEKEQSCDNCLWKCKLVKSDFGKGEYDCDDLDGYVCAVNQEIGIVDWIVGTAPESERCEMWTRRK